MGREGEARKKSDDGKINTESITMKIESNRDKMKMKIHQHIYNKMACQNRKLVQNWLKCDQMVKMISISSEKHKMNHLFKLANELISLLVVLLFSLSLCFVLICLDPFFPPYILILIFDGWICVWFEVVFLFNSIFFFIRCSYISLVGVYVWR